MLVGSRSLRDRWVFPSFDSVIFLSIFSYFAIESSFSSFASSRCGCFVSSSSPLPPIFVESLFCFTDSESRSVFAGLSLHQLVSKPTISNQVCFYFSFSDLNLLFKFSSLSLKLILRLCSSSQVLTLLLWLCVFEIWRSTIPEAYPKPHAKQFVCSSIVHHVRSIFCSDFFLIF